MSGIVDGIKPTVGMSAAGLSLLVALTGCGGTADEAGTEVAPSGGGNSQYANIRAMLPDQIRESGTINAANPLHNPPYAFLTADGETLKGIAPDLSTALEPILGVEFEWVDTPFPGLMPGLQAHKFDMIWGSITDTVERERVITFVDYHMDGALLLVKQGNPEQIEDIEDTCGKSISALEGSFQIQLLEEQSQNCTQAGKQPVDIKIYPGVPDAELSVRSGQTAAFFAGVGAARWQAETQPDAYEAVGPIYQASPYGVGFSKDAKQLAKAIQAGLKVLVEDGTYKEILERYGMGVTALPADKILINGAAELTKEKLVVSDSSN